MSASGGDTLIRRRHVIYVEGYDPQGAEGYYRLFSRSFGRFLKNWPMQAKIGDLQIDSDDFAHWDIEAAGPNWQVATRYEFLRQEQMIRANMAKPMWRQVPRALGWMLNYLFTGTLFRVYRASPRYGAGADAFPDADAVLARGRSARRLARRLGSCRGSYRCRSSCRRRSASGPRSASSCCCGRSPTNCSWCRSTATGPICCRIAAASRRASTTRRGRRAAPGRGRRAPTTADEIVVIGHSGGGVHRAGGGGARARTRSRSSAATARGWCC